jgi:hypothetical protein
MKGRCSLHVSPFHSYQYPTLSYEHADYCSAVSGNAAMQERLAEHGSATHCHRSLLQMLGSSIALYCEKKSPLYSSTEA